VGSGDTVRVKSPNRMLTSDRRKDDLNPDPRRSPSSRMDFSNSHGRHILVERSISYNKERKKT
jgi:hypothetical protein